jgi:hypothetical protein
MVIGKPRPRLDGPDSVTGRAVYPVDVSLPAMLHANRLKNYSSVSSNRRESENDLSLKAVKEFGKIFEVQ